MAWAAKRILSGCDSEGSVCVRCLLSLPLLLAARARPRARCSSRVQLAVGWVGSVPTGTRRIAAAWTRGEGEKAGARVRGGCLRALGTRALARMLFARRSRCFREVLGAQLSWGCKCRVRCAALECGTNRYSVNAPVLCTTRVGGEERERRGRPAPLLFLFLAPAPPCSLADTSPNLSSTRTPNEHRAAVPLDTYR